MKRIIKFIRVVLFINIVFVAMLLISYRASAETLPKIVLKSYSIEEGNFSMGEVTKLKLVFMNVGTVAAKNVVITYESEKNYIHSVFGKSNQIFIPILAAGKVYITNVELEVSQIDDVDAIQNIPIYFTCKCYSSTTGTVDENQLAIYAPINSVNLVPEISISNSAIKDTNTFLGTNIENKGYKDVYDVKMIVVGDIENTTAEGITLNEKDKALIKNKKYTVFSVGDIEPGNTKYSENSIIFNKTGKQSIKIYLTYRDKNKNVYIKRAGEEFIGVAKKDARENESNVIVHKNISKVIVCTSILGVIIIAIGLIILIRKKTDK